MYLPKKKNQGQGYMREKNGAQKNEFHSVKKKNPFFYARQKKSLKVKTSK